MNWKKSSYSTAQGNCVEVATSPGGTDVRDSKDPRGPALSFPADAWKAFIRNVKDGRL
jgi:hypothetical protein